MTGWYEPLLRNVLFPLYETHLRGRGTLAYLAQAQRNQWLPAEQLAALQWEKLHKLITHCWREVPYYQRVWKQAGAAPGDIRTLADYLKLPRLTKADIRANFDDLQASSFRGRLEFKATGGSTGEPLRFAYTRESYERRNAIMWRGYGWAGARMGRRTLYLWGTAIGHTGWRQRSKERVYHAAFGRRMLDAFAMTEANLGTYADAIDRYRPEVIVAYVGPLVHLAEWLIASGRTPHRPGAIVTGAEALSEDQRATIERAFGAPTFNTYGCREFMLIASECEQRDGLHVNSDHLLVESVPAESGQPAEIVITDLHNAGMPFMRYVNGDLGTPVEGDCACGRQLPRLARIDGRKLDAIRTRDGRYLPGEFFPHLFKEIAGVARFQVIQHSLDAIEISIVRTQGFDDAAVARIRSAIADVLGADTRVDLHFVEALATPANGKFRVTICAITDGGAAA